MCPKCSDTKQYSKQINSKQSFQHKCDVCCTHSKGFWERPKTGDLLCMEGCGFIRAKTSADTQKVIDAWLKAWM